MATARDNKAPRLLADIGGTNARFVIQAASGDLDAVLVLACRDYPSLRDAIGAYFATPAAQAAG
ncbi:MAG: glucokinase, partial [Massilia sp.]|nr:glucokinase [Massilia sp.]